jgi:hypothetical protein
LLVQCSGCRAGTDDGNVPPLGHSVG